MIQSAPGAIDRRSPVPFYFQLRRLIEEAIDSGRWPAGERLPSEADLCAHFGVSRTTVRQALGELEADGRLRKERGRGTFVAEPRVNSWFLQSALGFQDEATHAGRQVTSRILRRAREPLPAWAEDALGLPAGAEGVTLARLRSVDGAVVMYAESHLIAELADTVLSAPLETESLYQTLRERNGVEVAGGRRVVEAVTAGEERAALLEVETDTPLLLVTSVSWDASMRAFECYRAWHRCDRTKIEVHVVSERAAATAGLDAGTLRLGDA